MIVRCEYHDQLVSAEILRSVWFMHRVKLWTDHGYFLAWVARWKVVPEPV